MAYSLTYCGEQFGTTAAAEIRRLMHYYNIDECAAVKMFRENQATGQGAQIPEQNPEGGGIVGFFVEGITRLKNALANLRAKLTSYIAAYSSNPFYFGVLIVGIMATITVAYMVYDILKKNAVFMAINSFFTGISNVIKSLGAFLQVDTLITLMRLGDVFLSEFHTELAKLYEALGSLSEELSGDMAFIMVFTETNRALMHSAATLSGNSWRQGETWYAESLSTWLSGVKGQYETYMRDPQQIFIDIQKSIAEVRTTEADTRLGEITASIALVTGGVKTTGDELIRLIDELDDIKRNAPLEIQNAMDVWYIPFRTDYDKFIKDNYDPFWTKTETAIGIIEADIIAHGINIEEIQRRIKSPYDFFATIFGLPTEEMLAELERTRATMLQLMGDSRENPAAVSSEYRRLMDERERVVAPEAAAIPHEPLVFLPIELPPYIEQDTNTSWYRGDY